MSEVQVPVIDAVETVATGLNGLERTVNAARRGQALLLATDRQALSVTHASLALHALECLLRNANGKASCQRILYGGQSGSKTVFRDVAFDRHARGWIAAGEVFARLLGLREDEKKFTHVFCMDDWVADLIKGGREVLPGAAWVRVRHEEVLLSESEEAEHARQRREWVEGLGFDVVLDASDLLRHLPEDFWEQPARETSEGWLEGLVGGRLVLVDDTSASKTNPDVLRALSGPPGKPAGIVLISPHASHLVREHPEAFAYCAAAIDPSHLSIPVYKALLAAAEIYLAPTGLPFGSGPLRSLKAAREIHLIGGTAPDAGQMPDPARLHVHLDLNAFFQEMRAGDAGASRPVAPPTGRNPDEAGTFESWWQKLGALVQGAPSADRIASFCILTCCYKYLQRLRVFLDSIARQDLPLEEIEVCIAAPGNADGTFEYLELFRQAHPRLRVTLVEVPESDRRNRGKMINAAFGVSRASVLMVADCDLVLPKSFVRVVLDAHRTSPDKVLGCWRTPLSESVTAHIVTGNLDPVEHFEALHKDWDPAQRGEVREGILGYCQVVSRDAFAAVRYPEDFDRINQSDIEFVNRLGKARGIGGKMLEDLFVLHLAHSRDWSGTKVFL